VFTQTRRGALITLHHAAIDRARILEIGEGAHTRDRGPGRDRRAAPCFDLLQSIFDGLDVDRDHRRPAFIVAKSTGRR